METVELLNRNNYYRSGNARISVVRESYKECFSFEKVTYNIEFDVEKRQDSSSLKFVLKNYYLFYLKPIGEFTYDISDQPLNSVEVYYHKLSRNNPLVVGFNYGNNKNTYYGFEELKGSSVSAIASDSFSSGELFNLLISLNGITNGKIKFLRSEGTNKAIKSRLKFIGIFKAIVYTAEQEIGVFDHRLYCGNLFESYKNSNRLDDETLSKLTGKEFNAVYVYYTYDRKFSLMVDFIEDCTKYQFLRKHDGWEFQIIYGIETDEQINSKLTGIYKNFKFNIKHPVREGHFFSGKLNIGGVEVTRIRSFSNKGTYYGLIFAIVFFFSFVALYPLFVYNGHIIIFVRRYI